MEIKISQVEEFEVIPEEFKGEDNPPKFIFRTPTTIDYTNLAFLGKNINELLFDCFLRFEDKPILKDEKGKEIQYVAYRDFIQLGTSPMLTAIHNSCLNAMCKKIEEVKVKANKTAKK